MADSAVVLTARLVQRARRNRPARTRSDIPGSDAALETTCCIVGGGPAGMMLGFLLARAGVDVVVLEKHGDFLRDFRGDTIHPSTLEVLHELGLLEEFLKRPHQEAREISGVVGDEEIPVADFTHLPTHCKFIAFMPQWDFLDFIAEHAQRYPTFQLVMHAEVTDLLRDGERVVGVRATTPDGPLEVRAELTVRHGRAAFHRPDAGRARGRGHRRPDGRPLDADSRGTRAIPSSRSAGSTRGGSWS